MRELNVAPLSGGYMITSLVGLILSAFWIMPQSVKWGFTFFFFFALMFISALISMTYSPIDEPLRMDRKSKRQRKTK